MRPVVACALACAGGVLAPRGADAIEVEDMLDVRYPGPPRLSPDGRRVAATVDVSDDGRRLRRLFVAPADAPEDGQLGVALDPAAGPPAWSPDGRQLAVTVRARRRPQVALVDVRAPGRAERLTDLPTGARDPRWSPDGARLVFESRVFPDCATWTCQRARLRQEDRRRARVYEEDGPRRWTRWRDGRARHLFVVPAAGGVPRDLTPHPRPEVAEPTGPAPRWTFWGPERVVYVSDAPSGAGGARAVDTDLHLVPLDDGAPVRLTESPGRDFAPVKGPAGRLLYLAGPVPGSSPAPVTARVLDPERFESKPLARDLDAPVRDVAPFGPGALLVLDRAGHRPLVFVPLGGGPPVDRIARGTVHAVHAAGSRVAVLRSRLARPPELEVLGPGGRRLGRSALNARLPAPEVGVREVRARRPDGLEVHGFLVSPADASEPRPTVVFIHGGPAGAWTDGWHPRWNAPLFAGAGLTVLLPNLAGSVGYGRGFADRVRESWGGAPFSDLEAFVEASRAWPEVRAPLALAGASFGGYLVAWSLARSDAFACGVSHAGVFDPAALWGETDARWFPEWQFGGPPWAPGAVYERWSPARYAHRIRAPMLLTHGGRDYRVPVEQSLRLFATLERRGLPVRFIHFPKAGHFIRHPEALRTWLEATLEFLRRCLAGPRLSRHDPDRLTEGKEAEDGELEVLKREGEPDDGDRVPRGEHDVGRKNPDPRDDDPEQVHHEAERAAPRGRRLLHDVLPEREEAEPGELEALKPERDADHGEAEQQAAEEVLEPDEEAAEDDPDDVEEEPHGPWHSPARATPEDRLGASGCRGVESMAPTVR
jgi:dipeptidyl aminopeptidase/acylaminoacyl peptidase